MDGFLLTCTTQSKVIASADVHRSTHGSKIIIIIVSAQSLRCGTGDVMFGYIWFLKVFAENLHIE